MGLHGGLEGYFLDYESFEERPAHPVTGVLADYYWQKPDGSREPRWREAYPKHLEPARCWYSVDEVAEQLGKTSATVRMWLRSGALKGSKPRVGGSKNPVSRGHWMISGAAVIEFVAGQTEVAPLPERLVQEQKA